MVAESRTSEVDMKAEIISVGTELLLGEIVDTNTPYLADQLAMLGIDLYYSSAVGDNYQRLLEVLKRAWQRSDIIICTGGLGPTQDDLTRETIAGLVGEELMVDLELKEELTRFFTERGVIMTQNNIKQATLIPSAVALKNPRGTAPGWWVEKDKHFIIAMPGPPGEMYFMWTNQVLPRLQKTTETVIVSRMLKTFNVGESALEAQIAHLVTSMNPSLATYAKTDGVYLRIAAKAANREAANQMISRMERDVRDIVGDYIWGVDTDTWENVIADMLTKRNLSLAVADSFSGGLLAHALSVEPGADGCFRGGLTAKSRESKEALGIDPSLLKEGDYSRIATAMANMARNTLDADIGIGIEGYVETAESTAIDHIFIAVESEKAGYHAVQSHARRHPQMEERSGYYALADLRTLLLS
jgi:nicotinamide-nucleotide amidase